MNTTAPFDWSKNISIDPNCSEEMKTAFTVVLNDMARDPNGQAILKGLGSKKIVLCAEDGAESGHMPPSNMDDFLDTEKEQAECPFYKAVQQAKEEKKEVIVIDPEELKSAFRINEKTGELVPLTLNFVLAHELEHMANPHPNDKSYWKEKRSDKFASRYASHEPPRSAYWFTIAYDAPILDKVMYYENGQYDAEQVMDQIIEGTGSRFLSREDLQAKIDKSRQKTPHVDIDPYTLRHFRKDLKEVATHLQKHNIMYVDVDGLTGLNRVEKQMIKNAAQAQWER